MDTANVADHQQGEKPAPGGHQPAKRSTQRQRHLPYARPGNRQHSSYSLADRVLGICHQIGRPFLGRSPASKTGDAFSVPWRTVDRETIELREELYKAQREAAELDERRRNEEKENQGAAEGSAAPANSKEQTEAPQQQSPGYESIFETARKIGEQRKSSLFSPPKYNPKGKEADYGVDSTPTGHSGSGVSFVSDPLMAHGSDLDISEPVSKNEEDSEDDQDDTDFEPNEATDDDNEEDVLQEAMEPIDEGEEVTAHPDEATSPLDDLASQIAIPPTKGGEPLVRQASALEPANSPEESESSEEEEAEDEDQSEESQSEHDSSTDEGSSESEQESEDQHIEATMAEETDQDEEDEGTIELDESQESGSEAEEGYDEHEAPVEVKVVEEEGSSSSAEVSAEEEYSSEEEEEEEEEEEGASDSDASMHSNDSRSSETDELIEEISIIKSYSQVDEESAAAEPEELSESPRQPPASSSRSWWPFTAGSFLASPFKRDQGQVAPAQEPSPKSEGAGIEKPGLKRKVEKLQDGAQKKTPRRSATVTAAVQTPPEFSISANIQEQQQQQQQQRRPLQKSASVQTPQLFVPASFIDVSKDAVTSTGKRIRVPERSELKHGTLPAAKRRSSIMSTPSGAPTQASTAVLSPAARNTEAKEPASSSVVSTPLITAASLGLEARRSTARGQNRRLRRRTSVYYGSGYGSRSLPYAYQSSHTLQTPTAVPAQKAASAPSQSSIGKAEPKGSITAQKILDIIGEVPPARSQVSLESENVVNPYELTSPYAVRMRPKIVQQRRVLAPASSRTPGSADSKSPAQSRGMKHTKAILESIESAAPPEIQSRLGSALKTLPPLQHLKQPKQQQQQQKDEPKLSTALLAKPPTLFDSSAVTMKDDSSSTVMPLSHSSAPLQSISSTAAETAPKTTSLFGSIFKPSTASSTVKAHLATKEASPPPPVETQIKTPARVPLPVASLASPALASTPTKAPPVAASSTPSGPSATVAALAVSELQLPKFTFTLPLSAADIQADSALMQKVKSLDIAMLPVFSFTIGTSLAPVTNIWATSGFKVAGLKDGEWKCGTCDLKNPATATKCTVCDAPKPASKPAEGPVPVANTWAQSGFKVPTMKDGEWKCGTCDLKNPATTNKCTVCDASKPVQKPIDTPTPAANTWATSGFKVAGLKDGEWKCGTCDLKNPAAANKCTVCDAPKPASKPTEGPVPVANTWAQSGFKVPTMKDGEWKCGTCDLKNPATASKCTVCDAPKPVSKPAERPVPVANTWAQSGFKVPTMKDGEWKCGTCDLKNPATASKCTVCDALKPAQKPTTASASAKESAGAIDPSQLPTFNFELDVSKKPAAPVQNLWAQSGFKVPQLKDGEWKCSVCSLKNPKSAAKCTICDAPK